MTKGKVRMPYYNEQPNEHGLTQKTDLNPQSPRVHVYGRRAGSAATASCHSHFRSSTSVSSYVKFGDKLGVIERAMFEELAKLGERPMNCDEATSVGKGDGSLEGVLRSDRPGSGEPATLGGFSESTLR